MGYFLGTIGNDSLPFLNADNSGNDTFNGSLGNDTLNGGAGFDIAQYLGQPSQYTFKILASGTIIIDDNSNDFGGDEGEDTLKDIELVYFALDGLRGKYRIITGDDSNNTYMASDYSDYPSLLFGGKGNDILVGSEGDDYFRDGLGTNFIDGGSGVDTLFLSGKYEDSFFMRLEDGSIQFQNSQNTDTVKNIERFVFDGDCSESIALIGGSGNDALSGEGGDDTLSGGMGDDSLRGGFGNDSLDGGDGFDTAYYSGIYSDYNITVLSDGLVQVAGIDGTDILEDIERLSFKTLNEITEETENQYIDLLIANFDIRIVGRNITFIGREDNVFSAGENSAFIYGGYGYDTLMGGNEDDVINGGNGNDIIDGGNGTDIAVYLGQQQDYQLTRSGSSLIVADTREFDLDFEVVPYVVDESNDEGTDTIINVEKIIFANGVFDASINQMLVSAVADVSTTGGNFTLQGGSWGSTLYTIGLEGAEGTSFDFDTTKLGDFINTITLPDTGVEAGRLVSNLILDHVGEGLGLSGIPGLGIIPNIIGEFLNFGLDQAQIQKQYEATKSAIADEKFRTDSWITAETLKRETIVIEDFQIGVDTILLPALEGLSYVIDTTSVGVDIKIKNPNVDSKGGEETQAFLTIKNAYSGLGNADFANLIGNLFRREGEELLASSVSPFNNSLILESGKTRVTGTLAGDTIRVASGNETLIGGYGDDLLEGSDESDDILYGGNALAIINDNEKKTLQEQTANFVYIDDGTDILEGKAGDDKLYGESGTDFLDGGEGNDFLIGGEGNDFLDGGEGDDTAVYAGQHDDYDVDLLNDGKTQVTDLSDEDGQEGTDTLSGIEFIRFAGGITLQKTETGWDNYLPNPDANQQHTESTATGNGTTSGNLLTGYSDLDGDILSISAVNGIQLDATTNNLSTALAGGGTLDVASEGNYTFSTNGAYDYLREGESTQENFTYTVSDGRGGTYTAEVVVNIDGANDVANISGTTPNDLAISVTEDDATFLLAVGQLTISDADEGEAIFDTTVTAADDTLGNFFINELGSWEYGVDNTAVQYLGAGVEKTETFTVKSFDGTASQVVTITINGVNDIASISSTSPDDTAAFLFEDTTNPSLTASGQLLISDADEGEAKFDTTVAFSSGALDNLIINEGGAWSYSVDNSDVQFLGAGDTQIETFTIESFDGTDSEEIAITLIGVNDAPTLEQEIADQVTTTTASFDLNISGSFTDVDASDVLNFSASGLPDGIFLDSTTGAFSGIAIMPGIFEITVTATDTANATAIDTIQLIVANNESTIGDDVVFLDMLGLDSFNGIDGNDIIFGTNGDDAIRGNDGNDTLYGEGGDDTLFGGDGDDLLVGGEGNNELVGGTGVDTFVITTGDGFDSIRDFEQGFDQIRLGSGFIFADLTTNFAQGKTQILSGTDLLAQLQGRVDLVANDFVTV